MSAKNVTLTLTERDAIDAAKARCRHFAALACTVLDADDLELDNDAEVGVLDLLSAIREDLATIDATFKAADARQRGKR